MNSGLPPTPSAVVAAPMGVPGVKLKFCRYYAKDKTCFYGDECQFLHEEPLGIHGNSLAGYPQPGLPGPVTSAGKKVELGGLDGPRLTSEYWRPAAAPEAWTLTAGELLSYVTGTPHYSVTAVRSMLVLVVPTLEGLLSGRV